MGRWKLNHHQNSPSPWGAFALVDFWIAVVSGSQQHPPGNAFGLRGPLATSRVTTSLRGFSPPRASVHSRTGRRHRGTYLSPSQCRHLRSLVSGCALPVPCLADSLGRLPATPPFPTVQSRPFASLLGVGGSLPLWNLQSWSLQRLSLVLNQRFLRSVRFGLLPAPLPPVAPVPRGFQSYDLPTHSSASRPTLDWNPRQANCLPALDETYSTSNKFTSCTTSEQSGFASQGPLLIPWSEQV